MIVNSRDFINTHTFYHEGASGTIEMKTEAVELYSILEIFERYLLACGFNFTGHLDLVEDVGLTEEPSNE